jgi:eukaryotic-like serine/threonine-protein kinase
VRRARRPMMVLGAIGPALLLAVVAWFAWQGFKAALRETNAALIEQALKSSQFTARLGASAAGKELERRYQLVGVVANSDRFREAIKDAMGKPEFKRLVEQLNDPNIAEDDRDTAVDKFRDNADRKELQRVFASLIPPMDRPRDEEEAASWFFCDAQGLSIVHVPQSRTIGTNYAWRSFFHGGLRDMDETWRPEPGGHLKGTTLSAVFRSQATSRWVVAISTPVFDESSKKNFLGVVAMTVEVGRLVDLILRAGDREFAVLVDNRKGASQGVILQHPLFDRLLDKQGELPDYFQNYRIHADQLPDVPARERDYNDPLAEDLEGGAYKGLWLAQMEPVKVRGEDTGWLVIVETAYNEAIGSTLENLTTGLIRYGLVALMMVALVMSALWVWARSMSRKGG